MTKKTQKDQVAGAFRLADVLLESATVMLEEGNGGASAELAMLRRLRADVASLGDRACSGAKDLGRDFRAIADLFEGTARIIHERGDATSNEADVAAYPLVTGASWKVRDAGKQLGYKPAARIAAAG